MQDAPIPGENGIRIEQPFDLGALPDVQAVYVVHIRGGKPYLGRTAFLRRRLSRLLGAQLPGSRRLNLSGLAEAADCYPVNGKLPAALLYYRLARRLFPDDYLPMVRLRFPAYVKVVRSNTYPRTEITTRISGSGALHYGPFRSRAVAERFESEVLDQFQVRRCSEDLEPSPEHPGCIYGEMMRCLRPCQNAVSPEEYRAESERLAHFLTSGGASLLDPVRTARDRFSAELDFEQAQRQHERIQRIEQALRLRDDLASDAATLSGVAAYPSIGAGHVDLHFMVNGIWREPVRFPVSAGASGTPVPMDRRLRELFSSLPDVEPKARVRAEHLALLCRWYFSSFRDADWLPFEAGHPPYRRLVRAISKAAAAGAATP